jgi:hypothetical protein
MCTSFNRFLIVTQIVVDVDDEWDPLALPPDVKTIDTAQSPCTLFLLSRSMACASGYADSA